MMVSASLASWRSLSQALSGGASLTAWLARRTKARTAPTAGSSFISPAVAVALEPAATDSAAMQSHFSTARISVSQPGTRFCVSAAQARSFCCSLRNSDATLVAGRPATSRRPSTLARSSPLSPLAASTARRRSDRSTAACGFAPDVDTGRHAFLEVAAEAGDVGRSLGQAGDVCGGRFSSRSPSLSSSERSSRSGRAVWRPARPTCAACRRPLLHAIDPG